MTPEQFTFWLKGIIDASPDEIPPPAVWDTIKQNLDQVSLTTSSSSRLIMGSSSMGYVDLIVPHPNRLAANYIVNRS